MIPDSFKQDLLNRVDIVDVVGRYVQLKKGGANFMGLCPFHNEKTPSFTVSPAKQFYHCFGCQKHGNAIGFLMDYGGMGYIDALKELASGVGMQVPEWQPRTPQEAEQKERESDLFGVMQQAMEFYRGELKRAPRAIAYLKQRGLTGEIAARFGIGYAPDDWQGLKAAFPDYDNPALVECGLVIEGEGKRYDRFRDRILFPIFNRRDAVVGFGGRVLGEGEPKYLNSPETPLFRKGEEIYGLGHARAAMHEAKRALVVEGYMDVVALAQHGVGYAVATLGTATTPAHVAKLLRELRESGAELVFSFDGDAAGRKAAWRALEVSLPLAGDSNPVKFLFLPEGEDPDSYVRAHGKAAFERLVAEAQTLSGFLLGELRAAVDLSTPEGCSRFLASAEPYLKKLTAQRLRLQILKEVAAISGFTQDEVEQNIGRTDGIAKAQPVREKRSHVAPRSQEWALLQCVAMVPSLVSEIDFSVVDMRLPESQTLNEIAVWYQTNARPDVTSAMLIDHFQDGPQAAMVAAAQGYAMEVGFREDDLRQSFKLTILKLGIDRRNVNIRALGERLRKGELTKEEHLEYGHMISEVKALERKLQLEGRPATQGDVGAA